MAFFVKGFVLEYLLDLEVAFFILALHNMK
jgi:hypothetical protein